MHRFTLAAAALGFLLLPWGGEASGKPLFPLPQFTTLKPVRAVTADFDGDGRADLAITTSTNTVVTFHGLGDGTFSGQTILGTGGQRLVTGDFNGDGLLDLATTGANMFPGHGDGTFGAAIQSAGPGLRDMAAGDVNGDGISDLVAVDATGCRALLGTASGVFAPQIYSLTVQNGAQVVAVGDFDADGRLDLAVAWLDINSSKWSLDFMRGSGAGTFVWSAGYSNLAAVGSLAFADFDGDGRADLAANVNAQAALIFYFSNAGGFSTVGPYSSNGWMSVANLDGDGLPDLVISSQGAGSVQRVTHTAPRAFALQPAQRVNGGNHVVADFDSDGRLDLLVTTEKAIFPGRSDGTFAVPRITTNTLPYDLTIGDLNADGRPDIIVADNGGASAVSLLLGQGQGQFGPLTPVATRIAPYGVAICDLDGDGHQDVAASISGQYPNWFAFHYGFGDGTLPPAAELPVNGAYPMRGACADLDHDGRDDLVVAEFDAGTASVILGRADRVVGPEVRYVTVSTPRMAALGDFNEDGEKDLVVGGGGGLVFHAGGGDGTFGARVTLETAPLVLFIAVVDLDQDNHLDLAIAGQGEVAVLFGHGDGTFTARQTIDSGSYFSSVVVADFDRDGWADLFVSINNTSGDVEKYGSYRHNNHDRSFGPSSRYSLGTDNLGLAVGDFDADGSPDIAAATFYGVQILMNQTTVDSDGDGVIDGSDCAPANAGAFAAPSEISGLTCVGDDVSWTSQAVSAGAATVYDVVRGALPMNGAPAPQCLVAGSASALVTDPSLPPVGAGFWYLVRAGNVCGVGTYGNTSNGTPRIIDACP